MPREWPLPVPALEVTLEPLTVVLPELVSTAGRFEERAAEVTAPVVNIPKAEIAAQAAVATDQIVSQLPGLQTIPTHRRDGDLDPWHRRLARARAH